MAPEQQMKFIVEQTHGMCWHELDFTHPPHQRIHCIHCDKLMMSADSGVLPEVNSNPSPHDLNALTDIAKRNKLDVRLSYIDTVGWDAVVVMLGQDNIHKHADNPSDALRKALYQALGGK